MPWTPTLTKLRDLLADLYDDDGNRRRVAAEAGLRVKDVDFAGTSVVAWQHILETAQKHGRLAAIVAVARDGYGGNSVLSSQLDLIARQLAAEDAGRVSAAGERQHLETELTELKRRYDHYTSHIAAVDTDLGRALDSEQRLPLEDRREELVKKRNKILDNKVEIEIKLAKLEEGEPIVLRTFDLNPSLPLENTRGRSKSIVPDKPLSLKQKVVPQKLPRQLIIIVATLALLVLTGVGVYVIMVGRHKPTSEWPQVQIVGPLVLEIDGQESASQNKIGRNCSSGMPTPGDDTMVGPLIPPGTVVTITFAIHNDGTQVTEAPYIVAAVRGPNAWRLGWDAPLSDFPRVNDFVLAPGQTYVYQRSRTFYIPGEYFVAPTLQNKSGHWGGIAPSPILCFVIANN